MLKNIRLEHSLVVLDLETTGKRVHADRIVEISTLKLFPEGRQKPPRVSLLGNQWELIGSRIDRTPATCDQAASHVLPTGCHKAANASFGGQIVGGEKLENRLDGIDQVVSRILSRCCGDGSHDWRRARMKSWATVASRRPVVLP